MTSDYVPIDCDRHSMLELLAMRRTRVRVEALDEAGEMSAWEGRVTDVRTRGGAEFLVVERAQGALSVRLDRIRSIRDCDGTIVWRQKAGKGEQGF